MSQPQQVKRRKTRVSEFTEDGALARETLIVEEMVVAAPVTWPITTWGGYTTTSGNPQVTIKAPTPKKSKHDPES